MGHSRADEAELSTHLLGAGVELLVDIRRYPGSRTRPQLARDALAGLLAEAGQQRLDVMCSESVWWRCHRRRVADVAVFAHGVEVHHRMPGGRLRPHRVAAGARRLEDGPLEWDCDLDPESGYGVRGSGQGGVRAWQQSKHS